MDTSDIISHLSYDRMFGIMTRQAFELDITTRSQWSTLCVIDFDHIHHLNTAVGYIRVNEIIRSIFANFQTLYGRDEVRCGRIFSGDEVGINILNDDSISIMNEFRNYCVDESIGFKYVREQIPPYCKLYHVQKILDNITDKLRIKPTYCELQDETR